jgi:cytochrome d ubiquinol oxidase subunit I
MIDPDVLAQSLRSAIIAVVFLSHIQFAAFLIGIFGLGAAMELCGVLSRGQPNYDRLARSLARFGVLIYSTGAVLAIILIVWLGLFFPIFWFVIMRITFWPMLLEAITFALTIAFLFPWYYLWDRLAGFKAVHLSLVLALWFVAQVQQSMIDVMARYLLTPAPPQDLLRVFLNPTAIPLDMHRIIGDISFAGFIIAGYAAVRTLRERDAEKRAYFDWVGNAALLAGLGFLLLQPAIGVEYLMEIRTHAPGAFHTLMRGDLSVVFLGLVALYSLLFGLSVNYMVLQTRKSGEQTGLLRAMLLVIVLSALLLVQPSVIGWSQENYAFNFVNPIGTMQPWKYIAFGGITVASFLALTQYSRVLGRGLEWGTLGGGGRRAQHLLLALAILGSATMLTMGFVRERSRTPYLIYPTYRIGENEYFPRPATTVQPALQPAGAGEAPLAPADLGAGGGETR